MLSLYTLKSAADASTYYQQGDYYTKGGADEYSLWMGNGAERLALSGSVDFNTFKELLEGRLPNGQVMSQVEKDQYHRPGYDLTFSAPKSVSLLALVAGNQAVLRAHRNAVKKTIAQLEEKYAGCRNKEKGVVNVERTGNFTVATFEHSDSREGDPNLHTHSVLMNVTQRADGHWRTVYADEIYDDKLLIGMQYRSELAHELMLLGYEIELKENGLFEIKGVDKDLLKFFSKRREEIEKWLKENEQSGGKAASNANFLTRAAKVSDNPEQRKERWIEELKDFGSSLEKLQAIEAQAKERGPVTSPDPVEIARKAIDSAVRHLSERKNTFSFQELIKSAKLISLLTCNEGDLLNAIEERITNKNLIYLEGRTLTIPEVNQLKQDNIERMQSAKGSVGPISARWIASITTTFKTADLKERQALIELLTSKDRQVLLSANSKILLQQTLKDYIEITSSQGFYPRVITQNKINVESLKKKLGLERVSTVEGFLLSCEERAEKRGEPKHILESWDRRIKKQAARDVWVVDGDISAKQLNRLGSFSEVLGARIVFTQLKELPAIQPLKENGLQNIQLRAAKIDVENLKAQEALIKHITRLEKNNLCQENSDYDQRQQFAIQQYLNSTEQKLLITLNHTERTAFNHLIRAELKQVNQLIGPIQTLNMLRPLQMSVEEKSQIHLYQPGDIVRFNKVIANTNIAKESYFTVHNVDLGNGLIELWQENQQVFWAPHADKSILKHVEVFKVEQREVQKRDILVWNRTIKDETNKALDRIKGQTAVVSEINQGQVLVKLSNNQEINLSTQTFREQHWDYGYAVHLKDVELQTPKTVVVSLQNKQLDLKNIQLLNELLESAKTENIQTKIICNNSAELKKTISNGGYRELQLDSTKEVLYKREEALENYQTLATQPLFNRLQSEYLKVTQLNPELAEAQKPMNVELTPEVRIACDVVDKACVYHSERDAVIILEDLKKDVVLLGGLLTSVKSLESGVDLAIEEGWLIRVGKDEQGRELVTIKHTLAMEQLCIEKMKAGQQQVIPVLSKDSSQIQEVQNHKRLTQGQKEAITLMLTTQDRMVAIQGIAGAGKTTALKEIKRLCENNQFKTVVLANTANAKNQAKQGSNILGLTITQFLTRIEADIDKDIEKAHKEFGGNRLYIVDESSLASTQDTFRLQKVVERLAARLAWIGDFKQQGSIGAGVSFRDALVYGIQKAVMQENVRLNDAIAFAAMKQAYAGDMAGTLKILKDSIEEIPNKQEALNRMVEVYFALSAANQEAPLIITPLNKDRKYVNAAIREVLKDKGVLTDKGFETAVFVPTDKREIDKSDIFSYQEKDVIRFNTNHPRLDIKAGDYAHIQDIDLANQRLTLKIDSKQVFYWSPKNLEKPSGIEIYHQEPREFAKGDIIVFKRNNEQQGIFNGDRASITKIEHGTAEILLSNGNIVCLDLTQKQNQHLDHGYALTTYAAQGKDVPWVVAYLEVPTPRLIKASKLKVNDIAVLPKEFQKKPDQECSKIVQVVRVEKSNVALNDKPGKTDFMTLTVKDREGKVYTLHSHKLKEKNKAENPLFVKNLCNSEWTYFPSFEQLKPKGLPLSTSQQALLIDITRGDGVVLVTPYLDYLQKTLEVHKQLKRSALSYTDPEWQKRNENVNQLVANINGTIEEKIKNYHTEEVNTRAPNHHSLKSIDKQYKAKTKNFPIDKKTNFINKEAINYRLESDILGYATQWLGSPKKISGHEARWPGALTVNIRGPKAGMWKRWSTGEGGKDLISLYMAAFGVEWKEAIKELAQSLGISSNDNISDKKRIVKIKNDPKSIDIDNQKKINKAKELYKKAIPINGTLAEKYLKEHRHVTGNLPKDFKFIKAIRHFDTKEMVPALLAPIKDKDEKMIGIVRIFLNKDGSKYNQTFMDEQGNLEKATTKANLGIASHGSVVVQKANIDRTLWIAEGLETALSVAQAVPNQTVVASLSVQQIKNVPIGFETQKVVICADNDPISSQTKESIVKAVDAYLSRGVRVFIALPPEIPADMKKYDFNDLLKSGGIDAVQKSLEQMVEIKDVSLLKTNEPRLQNDINRIRSENERGGIFRATESSKTPAALVKQPSHNRPEKSVERGFER